MKIMSDVNMSLRNMSDFVSFRVWVHFSHKIEKCQF